MTPMMSKQTWFFLFLSAETFKKPLFFFCLRLANCWNRHVFQLRFPFKFFVLRFVLNAPKSIEHLKINKSVFESPPLDSINIILNWAGIPHSDIWKFVYIQLQRIPKIDHCKPFNWFVYIFEKYIEEKKKKTLAYAQRSRRR